MNIIEKTMNLKEILKKRIFDLNKGIGTMSEVNEGMKEKEANLANSYLVFAAYCSTIKIKALVEFYNSQFFDEEMLDFEKETEKTMKFYEDKIISGLKESQSLNPKGSISTKQLPGT
jgi:hypothetical protein